MRFPRASGLLLHISSLGGEYGIGDMGSPAREFADFLENSKQQLWQVLPLGPTVKGNSPYSSFSAFAGNPLLISPDELVEDGWIEESAVKPLAGLLSDLDKVDYEAVRELKRILFEKAFTQSRARLKSNNQFSSFCDRSADWLGDFSRFEAFMKYFGHSDWTRWPSEIAHRDEAALAKWDEQLAESIEFSKFLQFVFDIQWRRLKQYANEHGVRIVGDMSMFVAHESSDVWANQSLFCLEDQGAASLVAGVPPDYFSEDGQLWGNPLYRWDVLESTQFAWWIDRLGHALRLFDLLRMDHFRAFESYWEIPAGATTAREGQWRDGPRQAPFEAAREAFGELPIIAEDLGMITQQVHELRDQLGFPPMRVLQFGFASEDDDFHRPNRYPEHSVAYTGTHDNDTVMGWYLDRKSSLPQDDLLDRYLNTERPIHPQLVQMVLDSAADTAIVPLQDLLGLGNEARMNVPGKPSGNWQWRARSDHFTDRLAGQLGTMTTNANR